MIPTVYEMFQCEDKLYIVVELVTGGELTKHIEADKAMEERQVKHIVYQLL